MGNETNDINVQPVTESNKKKEKIIRNRDNNMLEESNNIEIDNNKNIDDNKINQDNSIPSEFDDFNNSNIILENNNQNNDEKIYIWIDPDINNKQNRMNYNYLINSLKIKIITFRNIDECFNYINDKYNKYKEIIIIISGKLFYNFIKLFRNNIKRIHFSPTIIIFSDKKELLTAQLKMNNMYYNNDLFDPRLIFTNPLDILNFIKDKIIEENDLTFDIIENPEEIIIPNYYSYILEDTYQHEIEYFNYYLLQNYPRNDKNEDIHILINQIKDKILPKDILIQYWLRIYTCESEFYGKFNKFLRTNNSKVLFYYPFIKLCYEELRKGFLESSNEKLYRCSKISIKEFEEINKKINCKNNNFSEEIPNVIAFSRSFLSFSIDEKRAKKFAGINNCENTYTILYIIEENQNIGNNGTNITNADLQKFSFFPSEKEILIFPFTCFEIVKIEKIDEIEQKKIDYIIYLKYLGNYSHFIEKNLGDNFFDKIQISKFSEELIGSGIVKAHDVISSWIKKKTYNIKLDKICFVLDDEEDCICISKTDIIVFNIYSHTIKIIKNIHNEEILDIIKLPSNRICSSSKDKTIKINKFSENNTKCEEIKSIDLYAIKLLFLHDEHILSLDETNFFRIHDLKQESFYHIDLLRENNKIVLLKKLKEDKLIYVNENDIGNKYINFINLKNKEKEKDSIQIKEDKEEDLIFIYIVLFNDYLLICFNSYIDIYSFIEKKEKIRTFDYFDYEITNILVLSHNSIILGFYDHIRKNSTMREHLLRISDLENNKNKFDCIGKSKFDTYNINNIIKINESKIFVKSNKDTCIFYERKNEVAEKLKESLIDICISPEVKYKEIEIIKKIEKEKIVNKPPYILNNRNKNYINNTEQKILSKTTNEVKTNDNNKIKNDDILNDLPHAFKYVKENNNRYINEKNELKKGEKKLLLINNK